MRSVTVLQAGLGIVLMAGSISLAVAADTAGDNKDMVLIPKGEFSMGSNEHSDEVKHQVVLDATGLLGRSTAEQAQSARGGRELDRRDCLL
ncbi:MAG: uncharacterized protein K0S58_3410 [Nitrospira sp.]|nr:uncharacterized protein [Nitrospira sp.]